MLLCKCYNGLMKKNELNFPQKIENISFLDVKEAAKSAFFAVAAKKRGEGRGGGGGKTFFFF